MEDKGAEDLLLRCRSMFRMRPDSRLDPAQKRAWRNAAANVAETKPEEWEQLEAYYSATLPDGKDYRRQDLATLLNNWSGELTRAAEWCRKEGWRPPQPPARPLWPDWQQLVRVWQLQNYPDDEPRTFDTWQAAPPWMRDGVSGMVQWIEDSPAPEGWDEVILALKDAGELSADGAYAAWSDVPMATRAQVHLLLQESATENNKQGAN
jgi:hypothetical protein